MKTKTQINLVIAIVLSLYISIKGSMTNGWFTCMGVTQVTDCGFLRWIIQVAVLIIIIALIFLGIEKLILDIYNKYAKKIKKNIKKEEPKKETKKKAEKVVTEKKPDSSQEKEDIKVEEIKEEKKVVQI